MALTILITNATGRVYRLGPDEPDAGWIPQNIAWGSTVPGGWKDCSFDLARRFQESMPLQLFDEVVILDNDGQHVYEGRIVRLPRQAGDDFLQGIQCLGWASHMLDDASFSIIFRDMGLGGWGDESVQRKLDVLAVPRRIEATPSGAGDPTTGVSTLLALIQAPWAAGINPISEAIYDAGSGNDIGSVYYEWKRVGFVDSTDVNWSWGVFLSPDDVFSSSDFSGNLRAAGPGSGTLTATSGDRRYALIQTGYTTAGTGSGATLGIGWSALAVHGNHGLALQGSGTTAGYYIDDMIAYALRRACPKINFTQGADGSLQRPPLVVNHATYPDPGSVEPVVLDLNKYVLWDWLVYHNRTMFYRQPDPNRLTWECRIAEGARVNLEGADAEQVVNGCIVTWQTLDGQKKVAGPVGSGFDIESDLLADTTTDNLVNTHGYPRKWLKLDVSYPLGDDSYALSIGTAALAQAQLPSRSGSIVLKGYAHHPTKGLRPVREILGGDFVRIADFEEDVPRRIVQTAYQENELENTLTVGNEVDQISAILEQVGIATSLVTAGG